MCNFNSEESGAKVLTVIILGYACCYINKQQKPLSYVISYKWDQVDLELLCHSVKKASFVKTNSDLSPDGKTTLHDFGDFFHPPILFPKPEELLYYTS